MHSYTNLQLRDLLDAFASTNPAPGGGSAAALAGANGVSLLLMAIGIRRAKAGDPSQSTTLARADERLRSLQPAIATFIDRDAEAYSSVVAALRLPVDPGGPRRVALDSALRGATEIPLDIMRACQRALREASAVAAHCTRSTRGDVAVAIELLNAAVRGAGRTIDANLESLRDAEYAARVRSERRRLESESAADVEQGLAQLITPSG